MTASGCEDMAVRLSAWIDGELDASSAATVREHLAGCVSCQRRHALLTAASRAVRSLPAETVSAGFDDAFRRRLAATRAGAGNPRRRSTVTIAAAGLAAVLLLAVLGPLAWRRIPMPSLAPATARPNEAARWLAACDAPTAGDCQADTPCASAAACGIPALYEQPSARHASVAAMQAGSPCASAATCGIVSAARASAGHIAQAGEPALERRR